MKAICGILGRLLISKHWWGNDQGWGIRTCRMCGVAEKAFYDKEDGITWEKLEENENN
jgi:hypothetical protein